MIAGIDFGTSACRVEVIDENYQVLAKLQISLPASVMQHGHCTQNPQDWWQALNQLMDQLRQKIDLDQLQAILIDGTSSTVLLADAEGQALTQACMYNDNSATVAAAYIAKYAMPDSPAQGVSSSLAKALSLLNYTDKTVGFILHQADWLSNRLCGQIGHSDDNNALKLGFDAQTQTWEPWLAEVLDMNLLPQVHTPGDCIGYLLPHLARQWGCHHPVKILAGTTDSTAAFIATGAQENGDAVTVLGSSLVVKILSPAPIFNAKLGVYSHKIGQQWLVGGASNTGGAVLAKYFNAIELKQLSIMIDLDHICRLNYYPLLTAGERFPINDPTYPPKLDPRPHNEVDFLYALLSGISQIESLAYSVLGGLGAPIVKRLWTTGGGADNAVWTQIRQRHLNGDFQSVPIQQAAYGSALLAARALAH